MKRAQQKRAGVIAAVAGATPLSLLSPAARGARHTPSSPAPGTCGREAPPHRGGGGVPPAGTVAATGPPSIVAASRTGLSLSSVVVSGGATAVTRTLVNNLTGSNVLNIGNVSSVATATPTANIANILQLSNANNSTST